VRAIGRLDGQGRGRSLLLLTTTGARSGQPRVAPLAFTRSGEYYVVIASKGGAPSHPDWFHNLVSNPTVTVEVGGETFQARARVAERAEQPRRPSERSHSNSSPASTTTGTTLRSLGTAVRPNFLVNAKPASICSRQGAANNSDGARTDR